MQDKAGQATAAMTIAVFLFFHAVAATCIAYLLCLVTEGLDAQVALVSLILGAAIAPYLTRVFSPFARLPQGPLEWVLAAVIAGFGFVHFKGVLIIGPEVYGTRDVNNFGDMPLHISYIRSFVDGTSFPPPNPGFPIEPLRYPIGADFYNALWESLGTPTDLHLTLTGCVATLVCIGLLLRFGGWWALGGMFLNIDPLTITRLLTDPDWSGIDFQEPTAFKNLLLALMVPQRSMIFALPLGLILILATEADASGRRPLSRVEKLALGALWGVLPLFHLHAFIAVSLILALVAFAHGGLRGVLRLVLGPAALVAYLPATLLVLHSTAWLQKAGIAHLSNGWTRGETPLPAYLWNNFGLWLLVPPVLAALLWQGRRDPAERPERRLLIGAGLLFALFFFVMLAPWDWDNIKLLVWPWLLMLALTDRLLQPRLARLAKGTVAPALATLAFLPTVALLWVSLGSGGPYGYGPVGRDEVAEAEAALAGLPRDAVFAASRRHSHPLDWLGRFRMTGNGAHLWSHGIDATRQHQRLEALMAGAPDWPQAATELGVDYILWGPSERAEYGDGPRPWMTSLRNISTVPSYGVYEVTRP